MTLAIRQRTPEWLAFRADKITATDAAVIAGEKGSLVELWGRKRGLVGEPEFDDATRRIVDLGTSIQPVLVEAYARETGRRVRNVNTVRVSRQWPVAACSPDGEVIGERRGLEVKMSASSRWADAHRNGEPVPGDVFAQVQWQMYVTGWDAVDVVALLWGRLEIIPIERDEAYIGELVRAAKAFWTLVETGTQPDWDPTDGAKRIVSTLYPQNNGQLLAAGTDVEALVQALALAKANEKQASERVAQLETTLKAHIGDADGYEGAFGKVTWRKNADSVRVEWPQVARAYRDLLADTMSSADLDDIEARFSRVAEGPRVLRLALKEAAA